jgi:hypothetical protein
MERNATTSKFIMIVTAICLLTFVLQHFAIYKTLIMPQLPSIKSVPLLWWGGYMMPIILVSMFAGYWSKSIKEIFITSVFISVAYNLFAYSLSRFHEPAYLKAYEGPFFPNFIEGAVIHAILFSVLLLSGYGTGKLIATKRNKKKSG